MGGKSTQEQAPAAGVTGFPGNPGQVSMQAAPPGMLDAIAAALAAGYGGPQSNQRAYLDGIYKPMSYPSFGLGAPAAAATGAPATQAGGLGAGTRPAGGIPYEQANSRLFSPSSGFGGQY